MSNLNPNAPSFPVGNLQQQNANGGNQGYNGGGGGGGGAMMQNDGYGGNHGMYDNGGGYPQGGGGGGGRNSYNSGGSYGGGNLGTGYPPSGGGYMGGGGGQSQGGYGGNPRMPRQGQSRGPMPHNQYQGPNMMGGSGGMRQGGYRGGAYHGNPGGMDMNSNYDQPPPPHMQMQQQQQQQPPHPMRGGPNSNMGMSSNAMGAGRMPPPQGQYVGRNTPNPRVPMGAMGPMMGGNQSGMASGNSSAPPPPIPAPVSPPAVAPAVAAPSYIAKSTPRVVMVVGYKQTGKTSVAKAIAAKEGFEYVSMRIAREDEAEVDGGETPRLVPPLERLAPLRAALEKKSMLRGLVLDDTFTTNRFQAHFAMHYLAEAGLQLDVVVALVPELSLLTKRGVTFDSVKDKRAHPEAFEFASALDQTSVVAIDEDLALKELVAKAVEDTSALLKTNSPPVTLEDVEFIPNCPLVTDPEQMEEVLAAERAILDRDLQYFFSYSEPNYVVDYVQFVQTAANLQYYLVTPWMWGDKVSLIGYDNDVYVHLCPYNLLFVLADPPEVLVELLAKLKAEADATATPDTPASPLLFSLEASVVEDVFYISDMIILGKHKGGEMILHDRTKMLHEYLGKLPATGSLRLLEHYPVCDIKECLEAYKDLSRGAIFVNPDGIDYGSYDVRNFLYPSDTSKTVRVRIWNGHLAEDTWSFDAYAREYPEENPATSRTSDSSGLSVLISDVDVDENVINDGNIIECVPEKVAAKGKSRDKNVVLRFGRRCKWEVSPITQYYMWAFADTPLWSTESFLDACSTIAGVRPVV